MHHDITFKNVTIQDGQPWKITNAKSINFINVKQSGSKDSKASEAKSGSTAKKSAKAK